MVIAMPLYSSLKKLSARENDDLWLACARISPEIEMLER